MITAREAAYLALMASLKNEGFVSQNLDLWIRRNHPEKRDSAFAYEIASGSARMALSLDYIATQLSTSGKLNLKMKEKALLRTAIYQFYFMEKVPLYAIVNETIELAKKYCHKSFASFINALLRRLGETPPSLPEGNTPHDLSLRYSYPFYFVEKLIADYGKQEAEEILKYGNAPPKTMIRIRPGGELGKETQFDLPVAILEKNASLSALADNPDIYIQNVTPVALIASLAERCKAPLTILDLCASPGGKLLAVHDFFPKAKLFANDVSEEKILRLSENLKKYQVEAMLSCGQGEQYISELKFDLIILDVPCSNSGVLNKRPEARWRLSKEALQNLSKIQAVLIKHAASLLAHEGQIWYMTCSILKEENEEMVERIAVESGLKVEYTRTILPNEQGWDGGFCAALKSST